MVERPQGYRKSSSPLLLVLPVPTPPGRRQRPAKNQTAELATLVRHQAEGSATHPVGTLRWPYSNRAAEKLVYVMRACGQYQVTVGHNEHGRRKPRPRYRSAAALETSSHPVWRAAWCPHSWPFYSPRRRRPAGSTSCERPSALQRYLLLASVIRCLKPACLLGRGADLAAKSAFAKV